MMDEDDKILYLLERLPRFSGLDGYVVSEYHKRDAQHPWHYYGAADMEVFSSVSHAWMKWSGVYGHTLLKPKEWSMQFPELTDEDLDNGLLEEVDFYEKR